MSIRGASHWPQTVQYGVTDNASHEGAGFVRKNDASRIDITKISQENVSSVGSCGNLSVYLPYGLNRRPDLSARDMEVRKLGYRKILIATSSLPLGLGSRPILRYNIRRPQ